MVKKIYVGNLLLSTTENEVCELFSEFGIVESVHLVTAMDTGRSRGSGFVAMASGAGEAIRALDRKRMDGRRLCVRRALPLRCSGIAGRRMPGWCTSTLSSAMPRRTRSSRVLSEMATNCSRR